MSNLSELLPSGGGQNEVEFVASGTLPNGQAVILNSNGTVTAVAETSTTVSENIPAGTASVFSSASGISYLSIAFDPNTANTFVMAYAEIGNSNYGTAIVGTVSGTSLTFGTEYVFKSAHCKFITISFDKVAGKFVVAYRDNSNGFGYAKVGTVSGTVITYGSDAAFNSVDTPYLSSDCDPSTTGKFVVAYSKNAASGEAVIGTISGTSITFGSSAVFNAAVSNLISVAYDDTAGKFVVIYQGNAGSAADVGLSNAGSETPLLLVLRICITQELR